MARQDTVMTTAGAALLLRDSCCGVTVGGTRSVAVCDVRHIAGEYLRLRELEKEHFTDSVIFREGSREGFAQGVLTGFWIGSLLVTILLGVIYAVWLRT